MTNLTAVLLVTLTTNWTPVGTLDGQQVSVGKIRTNQTVWLCCDPLQTNVTLSFVESPTWVFKSEPAPLILVSNAQWRNYFYNPTNYGGTLELRPL